MPLPSVSIIIYGTQQGVTTDFDGNYVFKNVDKNATLVFSYIGYKSQEIKISGRSVIDVVLVMDAASLDEIVVTGYSKERKVDITGAISVVDVGEIEGQSTWYYHIR